jgi:hypothetical protein
MKRVIYHQHCTTKPLEDARSARRGDQIQPKREASPPLG